MGTPATFPHCRRMFRSSTTKFERKYMLYVGRRVLVEDIIMAKLIKKIPAFCEVAVLADGFRGSLHCSLNYAR